MDANLRVLAAEDAADSTVIAASAVDWKTSGHEVLNYEGPFGVGYGVAVLFEEADSHTGSGLEPAQPAISDGRMLPRLARQAVMTGLSGPPAQPPSARGDYLSAQRGVFVTIRHQHGGLRGCVGTFLPVCPNVVAETWRSAQLAAFKDARFSPVAPAELAGLRFEVSVLYALEEVSSAADLDPHRFGVVVSTRDGRRGLLLPHVSGIRTGPQQLSLACEKGWIDMNEPMIIQRVEVDHFAEAEPANP
jgi:AmmeMemoRadiSam system protein A